MAEPYTCEKCGHDQCMDADTECPSCGLKPGVDYSDQSSIDNPPYVDFAAWAADQ